MLNYKIKQVSEYGYTIKFYNPNIKDPMQDTLTQDTLTQDTLTQDTLTKTQDIQDQDNIYLLFMYFLEQTPSATYNEYTNTIFFTAESVETLEEYLIYDKQMKMSHSTCIRMLDQLTKQIHHCKKRNYGFYGLNINDILVINKSTFIIVNATFLLPIIKDKIYFLSPIEKPYFLDPHLFKLTKLPSSIHYKCIYYSLGVLLVFCLLNNYLLVGNEEKSESEIETVLLPIKDTKLYWFLKRCFHPDRANRILLLI